MDVLYPPSMISTAMELTALGFTAGIPVQGEYVLDSPLITEDNAEQHCFPESPF